MQRRHIQLRGLLDWHWSWFSPPTAFSFPGPNECCETAQTPHTHTHRPSHIHAHTYMRADTRSYTVRSTCLYSRQIKEWGKGDSIYLERLIGKLDSCRTCYCAYIAFPTFICIWQGENCVRCISALQRWDSGQKHNSLGRCRT